MNCGRVNGNLIRSWQLGKKTRGAAVLGATSCSGGKIVMADGKARISIGSPGCGKSYDN